MLCCSSGQEDQDVHQHFPPLVRNEAPLTSLSATAARGSSGDRGPSIRPAVSVGTLNVSGTRHTAAVKMWGAGEALQKHRSLQFSSRSSEQLLLDLELQGTGRKGAHGKVPLSRTTSIPFVLTQQREVWACDGGNAKPTLSSQSPNAYCSGFQVKEQDVFLPVEPNHSNQAADGPPGHRNCRQCPYHYCCSAEDPYFSSLSPDEPPSAEPSVGQDAQGPPCTVPTSPLLQPASHHAAEPRTGRTSSLSKWCGLLALWVMSTVLQHLAVPGKGHLTSGFGAQVFSLFRYQRHRDVIGAAVQSSSGGTVRRGTVWGGACTYTPLCHRALCQRCWEGTWGTYPAAGERN